MNNSFISASDMAMSIYVDLKEHSSKCTPEEREAFYRFMEMKLKYLKGMIKQQKEDEDGNGNL